MGSAPTRLPQPTTDQSNSSSQTKMRSNRQPQEVSVEGSRDNCGNCETKFNLFTKKFLCIRCRSLYCGDCWKLSLQYQSASSVLLGLSSNDAVCKRCKILSGPSYVWNEIMELKARDLKDFLRSKHLDPSKCCSKEDLAELIMQSFSNDAYFHAQVERQRQVAMMIMRMQEDSSGSLKTDCSADALLAAQLAFEDSPVPVSTATSSATRDQQPQSSTAQARSAASEPTKPNQQSGANPGVKDRSTSSQSADGTSAGSSTRPEATNEPWRSRAPGERVLIDEITREEHLSELSSKQIKDMLAYNFVDYRGVLERSELLELARNLWRSRNAGSSTDTSDAAANPTASPASTPSAAATSQTSATGNQNAKSAPSVDDRELCKICMEREIDCVLLECGHLVTCTECGRVLADCPICRRFVARVVHIFKT